MAIKNQKDAMEFLMKHGKVNANEHKEHDHGLAKLGILEDSLVDEIPDHDFEDTMYLRDQLN